MTQQFNYRDLLRQIEWEDRKLVERVMVGSYRHAVTIVCSKLGRTKGEFANGMFSYFAYGELLSPNGEWIKEGNNIVPVLPDGRFIMVVEQRPPLARYPERPRVVEFQNGKTLYLGEYGEIEFPGGAINPGESFTSGFLRELTEETDIENQTARLYRRVPPIYPFSADLALRMFLSVVYLSGMSFADRVENDGGLTVHALTREDVEHNIETGIISSAQSALLGWSFWKEVDFDRKFPELRAMSPAYMSVEDVRIIKPK